MVPEGKRFGPLPSWKEAYSHCLRVAMPAAAECVLVSLIGSVDTIMVGQLGSSAISAVGITAQPKFLLLAFVITLNVGVTAIVARRKGEGDIAGANRCLKQALMLCALISLFMITLGYFLTYPILDLAGAQPDFREDAAIYFRLLLPGIFFSALGLTINAAQRGAGNTKISMVTNLAANFVNMIFNYLLIGGNLGFTKLGIAGAALATVIGSMVSLTIAIASLLYRDGFLTLRMRCRWLMDKFSLKSMFSITASALVEQVFMRIGFFTYAKIIAGLGTDAFATHQIAMNAMSMSFTFGDGLQVACASLVGQELGAKRPDLSIIYGKVGNRLAMCISSVLCVVFVTCAVPIMRLFTQEAHIIQAGVPLLYITAVVTFAQTSQVVFSGCLRGAGDTKFVAMVSFISIMFVRPVLSYLLCYPLGLGLLGAWIGIIIDQYTRLGFTLYRFSTGKWTKIAV